MIIRRHSIQSHDNLGADVFKLMIISVCCIQTQLIVFMPHAGVRLTLASAALCTAGAVLVLTVFT
jgi:hypothetical protein